MALSVTGKCLFSAENRNTKYISPIVFDGGYLLCNNAENILDHLGNNVLGVKLYAVSLTSEYGFVVNYHIKANRDIEFFLA